MYTFLSTLFPLSCKVMDRSIPLSLSDHFSSPPPPSPIGKILAEPTPDRSLLEDLLETSTSVSNKKVAQIQRELWKSYQDFLEKLKVGVEQYIKEHREIPQSAIIENAHSLAKKERLKMQEAVKKVVPIVEEEQRTRDQKIREFCEKRE